MQGLSGICKHYKDIQDVPPNIRKYDDGILMTDDAWFGVTPEPVANKVALHLAENVPASKGILIDCFAGVGGNSIAFALSGRWKKVYAIEKDENALNCAKHNADLYGVAHQISWFHGDCFQIVKNELATLGPYSVIFASPPWGD
ncbi:MAG: hypothetical protein Q9202_000744 [Teloschistes flavicans]